MVNLPIIYLTQVNENSSKYETWKFGPLETYQLKMKTKKARVKYVKLNSILY